MGDEPSEVVFLDADGRPRLPHEGPPPSRGWRWLLAAVGAGLLLLAALAIRSSEGPPSAVPTPTVHPTTLSPSIRLIPAPLPGGEGAGLVDLAGCTNCARVLDVPAEVSVAVLRRFPTAEIARMETVISSTTGRLFSRSLRAGVGEGSLRIDVAVDQTGSTVEQISTHDGVVQVVVSRGGYRLTLRTVGVPGPPLQLRRLAADPALLR